jgi:hypothetical protein
MDLKATFAEYLRAFTARWFILMSGPLMVPFTIAAVYVENTYAKVLLALTAIGCFIFSSYWIWRIEREARATAESKLLSDRSNEAWGNVRVADNPAIAKLFLDGGGDRNRFLGLLTQNYMSCWGRRMAGRSDLVAVPGTVWNEAYHLMYIPAQEHETGAINQTYIRDRDNRSAFFDAHLNATQLRRFWPNINFVEAKEDTL